MPLATLQSVQNIGSVRVAQNSLALPGEAGESAPFSSTDKVRQNQEGPRTVFSTNESESVFKVRLRPNEKLSDALRRFRKLTSGIKSKVRQLETYEKPSDKRRRERRKAQVRIRNSQRDAG